MTKEQRVSEPKLSKCGCFMVRTVKIGNCILGHIETPKVKPGERASATYWAVSPNVIRLSQEGRFLTVSQVFMAGLSSYGVKWVGLRTPDGTTYQTDLEIAKPRNPGPMRIAFRDVPLASWEVESPPMIERIDTLMAKMRIAGGRRKSAVT